MEVIRKFMHEVDKWLFFSVLVLFFVILSFIMNEFLIKDELYYRTLGEQLARERIEAFLDLKNKWDWIAYFLIPLMLSIKLLFVAVCLETGSVIQGYKTSYKNMIHIAMFGEVVFFLSQLIKTVVVAIAKIDHLDELQTIASFSLLSVIDVENVDAWFIYPLKTLNLYEVLYCLVLAFLLKIYLDQEYSKMLKFVLSTYGIGLLVVILVTMFINVNIM